MLDGIVTFHASHHAMRAEKVLGQHGIAARLVPGPRELSPSCGVALRFPYAQAAEVRALLATSQVEVEQIVWFPEARATPAGWARLWRGRP